MNETINITCKLCNSDNVIKYGSYKGKQRYYCKDCYSKFKADDTLFHMKTPANYVSTLNSPLRIAYLMSSVLLCISNCFIIFAR